MSEPVEASGRTVEEAIDKALDLLGASDDEVEIQILSDGEQGDPQLRSGARVRVRFRDERSDEDHAAELEARAQEVERSRRIEPDEASRQAEALQRFLDGLLDTLDVDATVSATPNAYGAQAEIVGSDLAVLIGKFGATLSALQDVARAAVQQATGVRASIDVDIEGYARRRAGNLERIARSAAAKVQRSRKPVKLEPMTSRDRKVVHDTLSTLSGISTTSEGDEPYRYVVVLPQ